MIVLHLKELALMKSMKPLKRILPIYQKRLVDLNGILGRFIKAGLIRIEDGGIKTAESVEIKKKKLPKTGMNHFRDITRLRIVTKDLATLIELNETVELHFSTSSPLYVRKMYNTY